MNQYIKHPIHFFLLSILIIMGINLSACVDLSAAKYTAAKNLAQNKQHKSYHGEAYTMLGGLGVFSTGMKELRDAIAKEYAIPVRSEMWYNAGLVSREISTYYFTHTVRRPVILVGHSLGANEQIKVARVLNKLGIPVDLLVTVDPVSQTIIPPNVLHAMNFYKSGYVPMFSGLKIRAVDPQKTHIENIDVTILKGVTVNHFTIDKDPVVQAMIMSEVKKVISHAQRAKK